MALLSEPLFILDYDNFMKRKLIRFSFTLSLGIFFGILISLPFTQVIFSKQNNPYSVIERKFKDMNQILYLVNQLYYQDVDMEELMDGAFDGIMEKLDPPSVFISAKDQKNIDEMFQGEFQGIGIEFDILNKYITVIAPVVCEARVALLALQVAHHYVETQCYNPRDPARFAQVERHRHRVVVRHVCVFSA